MGREGERRRKKRHVGRRGRRRLKKGGGKRGKKEINERKRETVAKGWKEEAGEGGGGLTVL